MLLPRKPAVATGKVDGAGSVRLAPEPIVPQLPIGKLHQVAESVDRRHADDRRGVDARELVPDFWRKVFALETC